MADYFSDSDGDKAVEEILSQAMDATVLEQVAAINCAGFTGNGLPSNLETRFQRLKSFPSTTAKPPPSLSTKSFHLPNLSESKKSEYSSGEVKNPDSVEGKKEGHGEKLEEEFSPFSNKIPKSKKCLSPCESSGSWSLSPVTKNSRVELRKKGRKSPSWDGFSDRSVSPPTRSGCFLCSPKKVSRRKHKVNRGLDLGLDWGKHDDVLSDLSNLSTHSQKKMIRKAMEEEERISREADKIVKWAKQASARMDISGLEDDLSDDNNAKFS